MDIVATIGGISLNQTGREMECMTIVLMLVPDFFPADLGVHELVQPAHQAGGAVRGGHERKYRELQTRGTPGPAATEEPGGARGMDPGQPAVLADQRHTDHSVRLAPYRGDSPGGGVGVPGRHLHGRGPQRMPGQGRRRLLGLHQRTLLAVHLRVLSGAGTLAGQPVLHPAHHRGDTGTVRPGAAA